MKASHLLLFFAFLQISFQSCAGDDCTHITYNDERQNRQQLIINNHVALDTTANLLHITVVDQKTGQHIPFSHIRLTQDLNIIDTATDNKGSYERYRDRFAGPWDVTVSHNDYNCLTVHDVEVSGGLYITLKLIRK